MWSMWAYYAAVVVVGIGFLTLGVLWTVLGLAVAGAVVFGIRHYSMVVAKYREFTRKAAAFLFNKRSSEENQPGASGVEGTDRRWMFPNPSLSTTRREGFEALSECFLLLKRMTPFHSAALFEFDAETRLAYPRLYSTGSEVFRKDAVLSVGDGVVGYCLSSGKTVHYADFKGDAKLLGYYSGPEDIRSVIVLPLETADRRLGALVLDSTAADSFSARIDEIRHLVNMLSDLLVRVQREESILMRLEEDRTLKAMTERMAKSGVSVEQVADSLCNLAKDVFPADRVTFVVFDDVETQTAGRIPFSREPMANPSIVRFRSLKMIDRYVELVARTKKTIRLDDVWENGLMSLATGQNGVTMRSMLASPFVFDSQVVGVVLLESDHRRAFNAFHETAIGELVQHAATGVGRAIEYSRMEKTCALADAVPAAAEKIFTEPSIDAALDTIRARLSVSADVFEIQADRDVSVGIRSWDSAAGEWKAPTPAQSRVIETGEDMLRIEGNLTAIRDAHGEIPIGAEVVLALSASPSMQPFALFCLTFRSPLACESLSILDRIRTLIQIRLVLERRERQFGFLKVRDTLTGVLHTAAFESKLEETLQRVRAGGRMFQFLLVQPGRVFALKRTHGFAETVRRYASLCSEIERLAGPAATVGRVGPEDIGVIWEDGEESMKKVRAQIERLSDSLGFQIQVGCADGTADVECIASLIESASQVSATAVA